LFTRGWGGRDFNAERGRKGMLVIPINVLKSGYGIPLMAFSLKRFTSGAFAGPLRAGIEPKIYNRR